MKKTTSTLATVPKKGTAKQISEAIIHAPLNKVFVVSADLTRWPEFLPHYLPLHPAFDAHADGRRRQNVLRAATHPHHGDQ